jgi:hypothetical protein
MDLEAAEGVRDLVLRYVEAINLNDLAMFRDTFTEDAIWEISNVFIKHGVEDICATFLAVRNRPNHWIYQVVEQTRLLSLHENRAKARSYIGEYTNTNSEGRFSLITYQDECVKQNGVWRFSKRIIDPLYNGPQALTAPLKAYPAPRRI